MDEKQEQNVVFGPPENSPGPFRLADGTTGFQEGPMCPHDGKPHKFDEWETGPGWGSSKCSKCGTLAMDYDCMYGP